MRNVMLLTGFRYTKSGLRAALDEKTHLKVT